ncbi:unnamed protein product [Lampetra fluviatilis]
MSENFPLHAMHATQKKATSPVNKFLKTKSTSPLGRQRRPGVVVATHPIVCRAGPHRPKRQAKALFEEAYWDCSVCTFRNRAEAFKCSICDVRKGTSTRKPRLNSQLVAQQVAQKFSVPTKKEKRERGEKEKLDKDREASSSTSKRNLNKKTSWNIHRTPPPPQLLSKHGTTLLKKNNGTRPKLKNIDRSSGQQLAVTVGNVTVIITDFKEKKPTAGAGAVATGPKGPSAGGAARGGSERGGSSSDSNTERDEPSHPTSPQRDESLSGDSH